MLGRLFAPVEAFGKAQPFIFQNLLSTGKTTIADYVVQKGVERKEHVDPYRLLAFATLGCLYSGGFQYFVFVNLFTKWFPSVPRFTQLSMSQKLKDRTGMADTARQVFIRTTVMHPLCFFPTFYVFKEIICNPPDAPTGPANQLLTICTSAQKALSDYRQNFWVDNIASWKLWIPADCIIFSSPLWLRLPMMHTTSMVFVGIVSMMRGDNISKAMNGLKDKDQNMLPTLHVANE